MKAMILLMACLALSACWSDEKEKKASDFMSGLSRCDDCTMDKPLIGSKPE